MVMKILTMISAVLFNGVIGVIIGGILGIEALPSAIGANVIGVAMSFMPGLQGVVREGVLKEVWTGIMVKALREGKEATFLEGIEDHSSIVDNDVIHLVDVGVDPDVLVNNTTYPIDLQALEDKDIPIKLNKFQTKPTPITDDELHAISYDKMARVTESHKTALQDKKNVMAAHSLTPKKHTKETPVLKTTGEVDPETKRRKLTRKDLVALKRACDKNHIPVQGRRLVLCTDHVNDLLEEDQKFSDYLYNAETGKVKAHLGFEIHEFAENPVFSKDGQKKNLGSGAEEGDFQCSFAFYKKRVFKANGSTKTYPTPPDAQHQRALYAARTYNIVMPKKMDACAAIRSEYVESGSVAGSHGGLND